MCATYPTVVSDTCLSVSPPPTRCLNNSRFNSPRVRFLYFKYIKYLQNRIKRSHGVSFMKSVVCEVAMRNDFLTECSVNTTSSRSSSFSIQVSPPLYPYSVICLNLNTYTIYSLLSVFRILQNCSKSYFIVFIHTKSGTNSSPITKRTLFRSRVLVT